MPKRYNLTAPIIRVGGIDQEYDPTSDAERIPVAPITARNPQGHKVVGGWAMMDKA